MSCILVTMKQQTLYQRGPDWTGAAQCKQCLGFQGQETILLLAGRHNDAPSQRKAHRQAPKWGATNNPEFRVDL
jgi:hypothetical protein